MAAIGTNAEFYVELDRLRQQIRKEHSERARGVPGLGLVEELKFVDQELEKLAVQAARRPLPPDSERQVDVGSIIRILVDAWSYHDPLANDLMDLCYYYLHNLA